MDKSEIKLYKTDDEARKDFHSYENDWTYNILEYCAMHKTGLKLAVEEGENGDLFITASNFEDWAHHMCHDEGLTGREVATYKVQLSKQFQVLTEKNDEKAGLTKMFLPYQIKASINSKHKS